VAPLFKNSIEDIPSLAQKTLAITLQEEVYALSLFSLIPYSPVLAPSTFHLFGPLKDAPRRRRFADEDELKYSVREELRRFSQESSRPRGKCVVNVGAFLRKKI